MTESINTVEKPLFFLRVSTLAHVEICSKRSKIESFNHTLARIPYGKKSALARGKKLHAQYGQYITDFDREVLKRNLELYKTRRAFQKVIELPEVTVVIRGDFDDLRIISKSKNKVSFEEWMKEKYPKEYDIYAKKITQWRFK